MKPRRAIFATYLGASGLLVVGLLFGFLTGQRLAPLPGPAAIETVQQKASLMLDFGDSTIRTFTVPLAPGEHLFDLLKQVAHDNNMTFAYKDFKGLGMLVEQIGNKTNTNDRSWQYWVNNRFAAVGADSYAVQAGDVIEWKYTANQPAL